MIIVEGPDGAGKTTLIKELVKVTGLPVAPRVVSKDTEALVDLPTWVDDNLQAGFQNLIFDRHRLISEPIYGPILRVEQQEGFSSFSRVVDWVFKFYNLNPIIIYCLPPLSEVRKNLKDDQDNKAVVGRIDSIYAAYVAKAANDLRHSSRVFYYDYTAHDAMSLAFAVKGMLTRV